MESESLFHELMAYTLAHPGEEFLHQYVVDAHGAQTASAADKPIRLVFALVGLYLYVEHRWSGRQVQRLHVELGRRKRPLPPIPIPPARGAISVVDVMNTPPGAERDRRIEDWCRSVWAAYEGERAAIVRFLGDLAPPRA